MSFFISTEARIDGVGVEIFLNYRFFTWHKQFFFAMARPVFLCLQSLIPVGALAPESKTSRYLLRSFITDGAVFPTTVGCLSNLFPSLATQKKAAFFGAAVDQQ